MSHPERNMPAPLYASPGRLPDDLIKELAERQRQHNSDARKFFQGQRDRILRSTHVPDIKNRLHEQHQDPELRQMLQPHINAAVNPADDVVTGVVQVYRGGGVRRIEGASDEQNAAFQRIVAETGISAWASDVARTAYMVGPKFAIPIVRRQRMRAILPPPQDTDVVLDAEDPTGDPVAIAFGAGAGVMAVLDGESLRYFKIDAKPHMEVRNGQQVPVIAPYEIVDQQIYHGAPDMPAAALRFSSASDPCDWFDYQARERLRQGALEIGVLVARLGLVRKIQGQKLISVTGELNAIARGQPIANPAAPLAANVDLESKGITWQVHDFDTSPAFALTHIRFLIEQMAESTGVPVTINTFGAGGDKYDLTWDHDALAELRQAMLWWVLQFERQFWTDAVRVAHRMRHPLAKELPTPEQVTDGFVFELPPLHRRFSDPVVELAWWKEMRGAAQADYLDMARRYHPGLTDELLRSQIDKRIKFNAEVWAELGRHNTPTSPDVEDTMGATMRSVAEMQGAQGGRPPNESPDGD